MLTKHTQNKQNTQLTSRQIADTVGVTDKPGGCTMEIKNSPPPFPIEPGKQKYNFSSMKVGSWVVVSDIETANRMQNAARAYGRYHGTDFKISRRQHEGKIYLLRVS